jgi:hypothetical protein
LGVPLVTAAGFALQSFNDLAHHLVFLIASQNAEKAIQ